MTADEKIAQNGHAQVLVILKPAERIRKKGRSALDLDKTRDRQSGSARSLEGHFTRFHDAREVTIAREMRAQLTSRVATAALAPETVVTPRAKSVRYFPNLGIMLGTVDAHGLAALEKERGRGVAKITLATDPELIRPQLSAALAHDPPTGVSWGVKRIRADALWDKGLTGEGITIGHVDTGIDADHPALAGALDAFAQFSRVGDQVSGAKPSDSGRHGTHTAGI
nr:hypothetical protein [Acidobacteriota bacterium]